MTRYLLAGALAISTVAIVSGQTPAPPTSGTPQANAEEAKIKAHAEELKKKLTPEQYSVTCEADTEPAFRNAYWNNHEPGLYVDVISGKALFSSLDKFDSGTGWPSFTKPLAKDAVAQHSDTSLGEERTEVRAADSGAHLGHVFDDGPAKAGGRRYCINSASLKFIPVAKLKDEGYGDYLPLFEKAAGETKPGK